MRTAFISLLIGVLALLAGSEAFRQQSVGVRGRLMCGTQPLNNTQIKIWNKNVGRDDQLAAVKTDSNGNYEITGGVGNILKMDVHFKIYHDCNDGITPCQRKVNLRIPDEYVSRNEKVQKWFEGGTMNMEFKFPDEERSCIN